MARSIHVLLTTSAGSNIVVKRADIKRVITDPKGNTLIYFTGTGIYRPAPIEVQGTVEDFYLNTLT